MPVAEVMEKKAGAYSDFASIAEPSPVPFSVSRTQRDISIYCDFIVQHLDEDASAYSNASNHVSGMEEKKILRRIAERKSSDIEAVIARAHSPLRIQRKPLGSMQRSSTRYWLDVEFNPILSLKGALDFIYMREYRTLNVFERFCRLAQARAVEALFDAAIWRQREAILWLDTTASPEGIGRLAEPPRQEEAEQPRRGISWALLIA